MRSFLAFLLIFTGFLRGLWTGAPTQTPPPKAVVRAVLFYSPTCGHCHYVMTEVLPPLVEQYGDQLQIIAVDASQPDGQALFLAALGAFSQGSGGVPFLVVGDKFLIGSLDIPEKFPGLIETYLKQGGVDWPAIPGLREALAIAEATATSAAPTPQPVTPVASAIPATDPGRPTDATALPLTSTASAVMNSAPPTALPATPTAGSAAVLPVFGPDGQPPSIAEPDLSISERFSRDLSGNLLAVVVLIGMICSLLGVFLYFQRASTARSTGRYAMLLIPALCLLGIAVAGYLAYVETTQTEAVCGPIGDCNTVQQSEYARLFGILPIGILSIAGYLAILLAWVLAFASTGKLAGYAARGLLGLTIFGMLFSIYLTFLEPFVIGASCAWCLTSAVIMTALFWLSAAIAKSITNKPGNSMHLQQTSAI